MIENTPSPWELLKQDQFDTAITLYKETYERTKRNTDLYQIGYAQLVKGDIPRARLIFDEVLSRRDPNYIVSNDYINIGLCDFYDGAFYSAIKNWKLACKTPYTDSAGGVIPLSILYYAGLRIQDLEAMEFSKKHLNRLLRREQRRQLRDNAFPGLDRFTELRLCGWPGLIVHLLLNMIDEDTTEEYINTHYQGILRVRYLCEFYFYKAVKGLESGDMDKYKEYINLCVTRKHYLVSEFFLARWEVQNGFPFPIKNYKFG